MTVGVGIITYKDKKHLEKCLPPLLDSPLKPKVIVFNSDFEDDGTIKPTNDGTVGEARKFGMEVFSIPRTEMNHGEARERTRKKLGTDIVVMMTPDAYFTDEYQLEKLVRPIMEGKSSIAYAKQIPYEGANIVSRYGRMFSFPEEGNIRSARDAGKYGIYTAFCSDACTAYLSKALDEIGGFRWVLSGEDAIAAAMLLKKGHKIAYVADAVVSHSHNYGPKKEFIRHFDTGMYRKQWEKVINFGTGGDQKRGVGYAAGLLQYVLKNELKMFPTAFFQLAMGWLGYQLGRLSYHRAPLWFYKKLSPADFFWDSVGYKQGRWFRPAE